jgi:outer membrane protein
MNSTRKHRSSGASRGVSRRAVIAAFLALVLLSTGLLFVGASPAVGADLKVGFIDSERIFNEYKGVQEAQKQFDQDIQTWKAQATEMKSSVDKLRLEVESQRLMLSDSKLQEKEAELQTKIREHEAFVQRIWGPGGELELRNEALTKPIIAKIRQIVDKIGLDESYSFILDAADGNIVFGNKALDLTDRVLEELAKME